MAETWLEELPTCLLFGDHRAGKKTHKRLAGSPREEKDPAAPTGPHAPIFCSPLSRNAGPVWLTPGPLPSENLPLKLITDKYQLVSSLQEVLGSGGGSELHLRRAGRRGSLRRGPALHHFLPPMAEAASTIGGGTALKVERLGVSFKPHADHGRGPGWAPQWTLGARTTSQPPTHFSSVAAGQFKAPRVTCPMWSLLICWRVEVTQSRPPTSVGRQAWGERPYLHNLLGFQPHDSLETQGFLSVERVSAQAAVRRVCSPKHRRGQAGTSWGAGHILPRTGCAARGRRSLGRGSHDSHWGPDCSSGLGGPPPRDRRQARGTHPPQDGTPSLGAAPRPHSLERSKASAQNHLHLLGVGPGGAQVDPGGGVHPGWTGIETPRTRNKKHNWHIYFFFPCFVFFFLFSLNLRKQDLRRQHSSIGLPGPEGHMCVPSEGMAGGAGGVGGRPGGGSRTTVTRRCVWECWAGLAAVFYTTSQQNPLLPPRTA